MTKLHESILRAPLPELAANADALETRGEFVLVIGPPPKDADVISNDALDDMLRAALKRGSVKDAVAQAVELSGHPRREVYARALALSNERTDDAE
jgi:16S rRNA (cytidine1402-2'-O)-methyltransferase